MGSEWCAIFLRFKDGDLDDIYLSHHSDGDSDIVIDQAIASGFMTRSEWNRNYEFPIRGMWLNLTGWEGVLGALQDEIRDWQ